jgi:hypothetical protein
MNPKLEGEVTLTFIRGGISKGGKPYLQVSNGRAEFFVNVPKNSDVIRENTFERFEEDDEVTLLVEVTAGSDSVKLLDVLQDND